MCEFNREDVVIIAEAILRNWEDPNNNGRYSYCRYCWEDQPRKKEHHKLDCPILVAKDILTGQHKK